MDKASSINLKGMGRSHRGAILSDVAYKLVMWTFALIIPVVCGGMILSLTTDATLAFNRFGFFSSYLAGWTTRRAQRPTAPAFITGSCSPPRRCCSASLLADYAFSRAILQGAEGGVALGRGGLLGASLVSRPVVCTSSRRSSWTGISEQGARIPPLAGAGIMICLCAR